MVCLGNKSKRSTFIGSTSMRKYNINTTCSICPLSGSVFTQNFLECPELPSLPCFLARSISQFSSDTQSCPTLRPHESQHSRPLCPSPTPEGDDRGWDGWMASLTRWTWVGENWDMSDGESKGGQSSVVSTSASVFPMNTQDWSPCSPRDSQEPSPTTQFKSINSLALNFLHSPALTSIHDHWKNHSLDQMDLCWQNNVSAF